MDKLMFGFDDTYGHSSYFISKSQNYNKIKFHFLKITCIRFLQFSGKYVVYLILLLSISNIKYLLKNQPKRIQKQHNQRLAIKFANSHGCCLTKTAPSTATD